MSASSAPSVASPESADLPARSALQVGLLLALAGSAMFSAKAIFIKLAYRYGVDAVTLITLRMAFAAPFFAAVWWWQSRRRAKLARTDHLRIVMIGLLGYYAASFFDYLGLQHISAGLERLILYLSPTIVLALTALWLRRPVRRAQWAALLLSYAGIVLVFAHDVGAAAPQERTALGVGLVFVSAVCYALYLVLSGEIVARVGALRLTSYAMCVSTAACFIQFGLTGPLDRLAQPAAVLRLSIATALISTVLPVFATMLAIARIGAGRTALAGTIGPVATIGLGYLFLDEPVSSLQLAGTALVIAGVVMLARERPAAPAPD